MSEGASAQMTSAEDVSVEEWVDPNADVCAGAQNACAVRKEFMPSAKQIEELELDVKLFWQLPRYNLHFQTSKETGEKALHPDCHVALGKFVNCPSHGEEGLDRRVIAAVLNWDVWFRHRMGQYTDVADEKHRSLVAIAAFVQHGWHLLTPGIRRLVLDNYPQIERRMRVWGISS